MTHEHQRGRGKSTAIAIGIFLFAGIVIHWGWNTFAVEILGASALQFKHSIALVSLVLAVASLFPLAWRLVGADKD